MATCHEVAEIRGDFARVYFESGKLYEKKFLASKHSCPFHYKAQIRRRPKAKAGGGAPQVYPQTP